MKSNIDFEELEALLTGFWLTDLANFSSYFFENTSDINWIGFYLSDSQKLRLGPFCGKPACTEIGFTRGVCGHAYNNKTTLVVDDVDQFPGHIRCDSASKSELVIPLFVSDNLVGVLDVDSPKISRFSEDDRKMFEKAIEILSKKISNFKDIPFGIITI